MVTQDRIDRAIGQGARRWVAENAVPLGVFAVTRLGLCLLVYFSLVLLPMKDPNLWRGYPQNLFVDGWARWDAGWYRDIADRGYTNSPKVEAGQEGQRDTAFFPVYPLTIRIFNIVFGNTILSGLIISNTAFVIALIVLFHLVGDVYGPTIARSSIILLATYPFSLFFSAMYTESLFLLAVVLAFYFGQRKQWLRAALSAAAAGATRVVGTVVILGLLVLYLEQIDYNWHSIRPNILWLAIGLCGLGSYMAFLAVQFGDPLIFVKSQHVPGWAAGLDLRSVVGTIHDSLSLQAIATGRYPAIDLIQLSIFVLALGLGVLAWRRLGRAYVVWSIATLLISFLSWRSMGRLVAVIFPLYIVAALLLQESRWYPIVVYSSVLLLALFSIMYAHFYWVA
jgi:Dolichyl-phosphate-mannose-protein mannosyltransferase